MKYRELGGTGIKISEIGFGAWGIGGPTPGATSYGETDDAVSCQAIEAALDVGINFFDTAGAYGNGHSEELLGQMLSGQRDKAIITTKAGCPDFQAPRDFSPAGIASSVNLSLARLKTDYIDLLMLHDPDPQQTGLDETFAELDRLKDLGMVRAIGISVRSPEDGLAFLDRFELSAIQANLNLMDQRALELGLIDTVAAKGCSVIARTPLCFGFLADRLEGDLQFSQSDHRSRWPQKQIECWQQGRRLFSELLVPGSDHSMAMAALRFCISDKAVAAVIPGILTPEEARENARASELGAFSAKELADIGKVYAEHSFFVKRPG